MFIPFKKCEKMIVNVRSFGATGDGKTNDTKAIQKALDFCRKTGGVIIVPDGTYLIKSCLIVYSDETLSLAEHATLLRGSKVRYMVAVYTKRKNKGYSGTHNVVIRGGTFDGNKNIREKLTVVNTCHAENILIEDCSFVHGNIWHFIEINSSHNVLITKCRFDGSSYVAIRETGNSELIQIDTAKRGLYGPVYRHGLVMPFAYDLTPCNDVTVRENFFICKGTPALGQHSDYPHKNIFFMQNEVTGTASTDSSARGYTVFLERTSHVVVAENIFRSDVLSPAHNTGIRTYNKDASSCLVYDNLFIGRVDNPFVGGITENGNHFVEKEEKEEQKAE